MSNFRAMQEGDELFIEGTVNTSYPGYDYEIDTITINDDDTIEVVLQVFDPEPGMVKMCVIGDLEINFSFGLSNIPGYTGQRLKALHLKTPGAIDDDADIDID